MSLFTANRRLATVTALLLTQAALVYALSWKEIPARIVPLLHFPRAISDWRVVGEGLLESDVLEQLRPDDYLARDYQSSPVDEPGGGAPLSLFIGYFESQRLGNHPHSPRRCLPGSGWAPYEFREAIIPASADTPAFPVNEYTLERGSNRIVVLYWYQNQQRAVATELSLKIHLLPDFYRYRRSDVALVRVIQPQPGNPSDLADFSRHVYAALSSQFSPLP